jgi:predicted metal-binding protein
LLYWRHDLHLFGEERTPMGSLSKDDLWRIYDRALALGAARASLFSAREIVVDERTRLKCMAPRCVNYGKSMCPPNLMSVDEFRKILARYEHALLVQVPMASEVEALRARMEDGETLSGLAERFEGQDRRSLSYRAFYDLIARLEAEAFKLGCRFATAFGIGNYREALSPEECGKREPPFFARPSMEAMGIDVIETARRAGLPISFDPGGPLFFSGLILLD